MKKHKEEWWSGKHRNRIMHEKLPNLALEKHALLGAGLMWKRMLATATRTRRGQRPEGEVADTTAWKALPLIPVWVMAILISDKPLMHVSALAGTGKSVVLALLMRLSVIMDKQAGLAEDGVDERVLWLGRPPSLQGRFGLGCSFRCSLQFLPRKSRQSVGDKTLRDASWFSIQNGVLGTILVQSGDKLLRTENGRKRPKKLSIFGPFFCSETCPERPKK